MASTNTAGTVTVTATGFDSNVPDVDLTSKGHVNFFRFQSSSTSIKVTISFDGVNDHVVINPAINQLALVPRTVNVKKLWFKVASGSSDVTWEAHDALARRGE